MKINLKLIIIVSIVSVLAGFLGCKNSNANQEEYPQQSTEQNAINLEEFSARDFKEKLVDVDLSTTKTKLPLIAKCSYKALATDESIQNIVTLNSEKISYSITKCPSFVSLEILKSSGKSYLDFKIPEDAYLEKKEAFYALTRIITINKTPYLCTVATPHYEVNNVNDVMRIYEMMGMLRAK